MGLVTAALREVMIGVLIVQPARRGIEADQKSRKR
jgi:hypothetical protein